MKSNEISLQDRIKSVRLTRTESRVAAYLAANESALSFKSAKDIAQALNISDTSVIRTCRSLGYKGYADLQEQNKAMLENYVESSRYVIPVNQVVQKLERYQASDNSICLDMALESIQAAHRNNAPDKFLRAAELLYESEHITVAGFRGMSGPARSLSTLLRQYLPHVECFTDLDTLCVEKMLDCRHRDCVVLLSVERYSKMSCLIAEMARESGSRLITIVDKITAPVSYQADLVLVSDFSSPLPINSFVATQFIAESIIFEISKLKGLSQEQRLSRLNEKLEKLDLY